MPVTLGQSVPLPYSDYFAHIRRHRNVQWNGDCNPMAQAKTRTYKLGTAKKTSVSDFREIEVACCNH